MVNQGKDGAQKVEAGTGDSATAGGRRPRAALGADLGGILPAVTQKTPSPLSPSDAYGQVATLIRAFSALPITPLIVLFLNPFARAFDLAAIG